ncbi:hypothetical protein FB451DRAFT_1533439 [Mycena latifolia]|nr:hypothetical protein FB451DRAFT_1533439 [Mycena latifolia]
MQDGKALLTTRNFGLVVRFEPEVQQWSSTQRLRTLKQRIEAVKYLDDLNQAHIRRLAQRHHGGLFDEWDYENATERCARSAILSTAGQAQLAARRNTPHVAWLFLKLRVLRLNSAPKPAHLKASENATIVAFKSTLHIASFELEQRRECENIEIQKGSWEESGYTAEGQIADGELEHAGGSILIATGGNAHDGAKEHRKGDSAATELGEGTGTLKSTMVASHGKKGMKGSILLRRTRRDEDEFETGVRRQQVDKRASSCRKWVASQRADHERAQKIQGSVEDPAAGRMDAMGRSSGTDEGGGDVVPKGSRSADIHGQIQPVRDGRPCAGASELRHSGLERVRRASASAAVRALGGAGRCTYDDTRDDDESDEDRGETVEDGECGGGGGELHASERGCDDVMVRGVDQSKGIVVRPSCPSTRGTEIEALRWWKKQSRVSARSAEQQ